MSDEATWRPVEVADHEAVVALVDAANEADGVDERYSREELEEMLDGPGCDPARDTRVAVGPDGDLRAWGTVLSRGEPTGGLDRVFLGGGVHPAHRGQGLGRALLAWQVDRAGHIHRAQAPDLPGAAEVFCRSGLADRERLYRRFGMDAVRWWIGLGQPLTDLPPAPTLPEGVRLVPLAEVDGDAVRLAFNAAWVDHWGGQARDEARWEAEVVGSAVFRADLSSVAVAGDEVVAFLLADRFPNDDEVRGHAEAWIVILGTVRGWRGRGLASALVVRALHAFAADGLDHAMIGVDADSPTGAADLYRRLGFVEEAREVSWAVPL